MSIYIDSSTRVVVQGITGSEGGFHTRRMLEYGTHIVAGVTPGKGGASFEGVPVYNTVEDAVKHQRANAAIIFVPAAFAADAMLESADAGIPLIVCISERVPLHDMFKVYPVVRSRGVSLIGPNCPGVISPGKSKLGILPAHVFQEGQVGIVSRSGTLTYEIADQLSRQGIGQSTVVGIGGDPIVGSSFVDVIGHFNEDPETHVIVLVGEIGGSDEETAAKFVAERVKKPVVAYIAGFSAPPGKRMGHAGAIISGGEGTAEAKAKALEGHGIPVARLPKDIVKLVQQRLGKPSKGGRKSRVRR